MSTNAHTLTRTRTHAHVRHSYTHNERTCSAVAQRRSARHQRCGMRVANGRTCHVCAPQSEQLGTCSCKALGLNKGRSLVHCLARNYPHSPSRLPFLLRAFPSPYPVYRVYRGPAAATPSWSRAPVRFLGSPFKAFSTEPALSQPVRGSPGSAGSALPNDGYPSNGEHRRGVARQDSS